MFLDNKNSVVRRSKPAKSSKKAGRLMTNISETMAVIIEKAKANNLVLREKA